jgi:hypothetical protein
MKKLAVLIVAACATVLSIGQSARAAWQPLVRADNGTLYYYDENYTHPTQPNSNQVVARLKGQNLAPIYVIFSCQTVRGFVSENDVNPTAPYSSDFTKLKYVPVPVADTSNTIASVYRVQYCQGQVNRNLNIMGGMETRGRFMNDMIRAVPGRH